MDTKTYSCCIREVNVLVFDLEEEMVNVLKEFVSDMIGNVLVFAFSVSTFFLSYV